MFLYQLNVASVPPAGQQIQSRSCDHNFVAWRISEQDLSDHTARFAANNISGHICTTSHSTKRGTTMNDHVTERMQFGAKFLIYVLEKFRLHFVNVTQHNESDTRKLKHAVLLRGFINQVHVNNNN